MILSPGITSVIKHVFIQDSSVTTGAGKTALAYGDITAYYVRAGGTLTALTMETIATLGTWASSGNNYLGFKLLHDTNAPGVYEIHLPNNILAAGANQVTIQLRATGAAPCNIEIQLKDVSNVAAILGTAVTETSGGYLAAAFKKLFDVASPVLTGASVNQTGDNYALLGTIRGTDNDTLKILSEQLDGIHSKTTNLPASPAAVGSVMGKSPATLAAGDVTGNLPAVVKAQDNIDFGALQKTSLNAATPASVQNIPATGSGFTALGDTRLANLDATISTRALETGGNVAAILEDTGTTIPSLIDALPTAAEIKTALEADGSKLDHLWETTEDDGGVRRFTENALEEAPTGGSAPTVEEIAEGVWDEALSIHLDVGSTGAALDAAKAGSGAGAGAITWVYNLKDSATGLPIADADIWVSTNINGSNVIAAGKSDQFGNVTFYLDTGTVYVWRQKSGWIFTNPDIEEVIS